MKINNRLKKIGDLVDANSFCLDVGCDHGLLDIYLVEQNKNIRAVASDIKEGPLNIAKENIKKEKMENLIETRLGAGLDTYTDDIDTIIISGMGGKNMIGIFKDHLEVLKKVNTIIVSPNNYQVDVRKFLIQHGFYVDDEVYVKEKNIIYQIMKLKVGKRTYHKKQLFFGPIFLQKKEPLFFEYYKRELLSRNILLSMLPKNYYYKRFITKLEISRISKELK